MTIVMEIGTMADIVTMTGTETMTENIPLKGQDLRKALSVKRVAVLELMETAIVSVMTLVGV